MHPPYSVHVYQGFLLPPSKLECLGMRLVFNDIDCMSMVLLILLQVHVFCQFGAILPFIFQVRSISNSSWFGNTTENDQEKLREKIDPGLRLGDYPVLPWRSAQLEKPTGWWDNQDRRNKETPVSCN